MKRKPIFGVFLLFLLINILPSVLIIRPVKAVDEYIYIKADGSIDPPTAPIQREEDIYYILGNISATIFVERSNISMYGYGYTVQNGGFQLFASNVMVENVNIKSCWEGISINGIWGDQSFGSYIIIDNCTVQNNVYGLTVHNWTTNTIIRNSNFIANTVGLAIAGDTNAIYHNNFANNTNDVAYCWGYNNRWDGDYPSGGNYWSNYKGYDDYSGPNQDEPGSDGIGDTPYIIDENYQDRYPLMAPFVPLSPPSPSTPPVANFTVSKETAYTGEHIVFNASNSYDPDGLIVSYSWDFGDGKTGWGVTTDHRYFDNGTYPVTLTVIDNQGLGSKDSKVVTIFNRSPVAIFTESAENVYPGVTIHFDASQSYDPDGFITEYFWDFGDGSDATGLIVDHAYTDRGSYIVILTVTDDDGAMSSASAVKNVLNRPPIVSCTDNATTALTYDVIFFDASASYDPDGYIVGYFWDFGDGTTATDITTQHSYVDNGYYNVTLEVTDNEGAVSIYSKTKTILNRSPVASFTENATTVLTGEAINFDASNSYDLDGFIANYLWNFGDGKTAASVRVNHAYSDDGTYLVTLKVIDDDGATDVFTSIKVVLNRPPVALFSETTEVAPTGQNITFDATLSYDPDGFIADYLWDFGDGTTTNGKTVTHVYLDNGTYTVTLVVTDDDNANASSTSTKSILNRPPVVSFTQSAETVLTGETVTFNASNSYDPDGYIVNYFWDFGNGASTSGIFINYSYAENGIYTVTLAVMDDDGEYSVAYSVITVFNRPPVASFTESAETILTGEVIRFDASTSYDLDGNIVSYFWNFGDGTNATGMIVSHTYADNGVYIVTLTVTDNDGATDSAYATKTVLNRSPVASFTESAETVTVGEFITFNALSSYDPDGFIISYSWDFGDRTTAMGVVVSHAYAAQGTYTVTLTVTDDNGATAMVTAIKTVLKPPIASFTWAPLMPKVGEPVSFDGSASKPNGGTIVKYEWIFGDGGYATGKTVMYTYSGIGAYNITLKVIDSEGLWDTEQKQIVLNVDLPPDLAVSSPDITFSDYNPSENQVIIISATIHNVGDGNAKNLKVLFFDTDTLIGEDQISFVSYHTSGVASVEWTAARQGFHLMRVIVDPSNTIQETDEENNEATRSVLVGRLVGYGGIEISPSTNSYEAYPGQNITVSGMATYRLKYEENGETKYYSEPVAGANVTVTIVGEKWLWETHSMVDGRFWVEIGVPYFLGSYEIKVEVTDFTFWENVVYQLVVKQYEGGPGGEPVEGIDLTILEWNAPWISFDPSNPLENDVVMVTARVFNIGTIGASNILVRFYEGSTIIGERMIDNIAAHDNRSTSIWWKAWSAGWHTITVQVDPYNLIPELNENNNVGSKKIYVYPAWPDLAPTRIELSDWTPVINQLVAITATVANLGGVEANNVLVRFYDNGTFIGKHVIFSILGKGDSKTALISHTFTTAGFHVIKVVVDPENSIIEAREDNNERYCTIYVHVPSIDLTFPSYINADLRGWDITFSNATPTIGDVITISSGIHNVGELEANNVVVKFFDNDTEIGSVHIASIPGNSYQTASVSWNAFPEGLHKITVIIDPDNTVTESNEFNNKATGCINVYLPYEPPSDLYIYSEDIVFSNTNPDRGENVIIYATVHNNGPASAQNFNVTFYINNRPLDYKTIDSILAEASQTVSIHWRVDVGNGSYVIRVEIDPEYAIRDPIRTNNTATRAIIVGMPPKAPPVASFAYTPDDPIIGETVTFWALGSYDPDGGTIANYRWEFYRLTAEGAIVFPPIKTDEGEILYHSFSSKGDYLVILTVTDDEGATSKAAEIVEILERWSFVFITDLHIGGLYDPYYYNPLSWQYRSLDYGSQSWEVNESGPEYSTTEYLRETVRIINSRIEECNIKFVVVGGDFTDSAEISEFNKAIEILNELDVPWIPIIGNHDVWPHVSREDAAPEELSDKYFNDIFVPQYNYLSNLFPNWEKAPVPVWNPETNPNHPSYFQNFAFDYKGYHFVGLDFNARDNAPFPFPGVSGEGDLHNFPGGTWDWFTKHLKGYIEEHPNSSENIILLAHHPFRKVDPLGRIMGFSEAELHNMTEFLKPYRSNVWGLFAGHVHTNSDWWFDDIMHVIETEANVKGPIGRIVQVYYNRIDYASAPLEGYAEWPSESSVWREGKLKPGDILYDSNGFLGFGHVGIYIGNEEVVEAERSGVKIESIETWDYPNRKNVYILRVDCADEIKEAAISFAETQVGKPYDMNWRQKDPDPNSLSWYCSELVWAAYYNQGINIEYTPDSSAVTPYEIFVDDHTFVVGGHIIDGKPKRGIAVLADCPIDLTITDPDGLTISKELNEIPEALYVEDDLDGDGSPDDLLIIPEPKTGEYQIIVILESNADHTATYTLKVLGDDATITLAENVPVSQIPTEPYIFNPSELSVPPTTLLDIEEPKFVAEDITYLTSNTGIALTAEDNPGGTGVASTAYRIYNATYDSSWILYTQPFYLNGLTDGLYKIDYNSADYAGNVELTQTATIMLDNTSPATTLTIGEPKYLSETAFITPDTPITLEAADDTGSGVYSIAYRIFNGAYDSGWLPYTAQFYLAGLTNGVYTIEFYSTDNLGTVEATNTIQVTLFSWTYIFTDSYGRGTTLKINTQHKLFQFITPDKTFSIKYDPHMYIGRYIIAISYEDNEIQLYTITIDTRVGFCTAYARDTQTGKTYWLIDKPNRRGQGSLYLL